MKLGFSSGGLWAFFNGHSNKKARLRIQQAVAETLEQRMLLSIVPVATGPATYDAGDAYPLALSVTGGTVSYWSINWGDSTR
jgi:hypothetical protein